MRPHGTSARYKALCRCDECRAANTAYQRQLRGTGDGTVNFEPNAWAPVNGCLPVECWCRRTVVKVPVEDVKALLTRSCGAADCEPDQARTG